MTAFGNLTYRRTSKVTLKFCVWVIVRMAMPLKLETQKMGQGWEG